MFFNHCGGNRTRRDFNALEHCGVVVDVGTRDVDSWTNSYRQDFPDVSDRQNNLVGGRTIARNMKRGRVYAVVVAADEVAAEDLRSVLPQNVQHNVLIKKVQRNRKTGKYRYDLMDPNKPGRIMDGKKLRAKYRRHVVLGQ